MNKLLIVAILALAVPLTVFAEPPNMEARADKHAERLTKELSLNSEQTAKVKAIFENQWQKLKAIHEETDASLKAVLTPEQVTKLDALKEKHREAHKGKWADKK